MTLQVAVPGNHVPERESVLGAGGVVQVYPITDSALRWLEVILAERFGHAWLLTRTPEGLRLELVGAEGAILFDTLCEGFIQAHSDQPFTRWDAAREGWSSVLGGPLPAPGVAKLPSPLIEPCGAAQVIHYDILGLTYWMLARVEEIGRTDLDNHERFPATASHAFKHGYLDRPVVDEWLYVLGQVIQRQWRRVGLKRHVAQTLVSCDVDSPFALDGSWAQWIRRIGGDVLKRRSVRAATKSVAGKWYASRGDYRFDAHRNGVDFIMDSNECAGRQVAFYFIPEHTDPVLDGQPRLHKPHLRRLLRDMHERGHEIGVHPGYHTYRHPENMARSVSKLRRVLEEERIDQPVLGGRQHFLRWQTPTTARLWDANGLDYDTTLSYADRPGFRCGTCFEYPMFDAVEQCALRVRQRPLVLMECSVIAERYLGLGYSDEALEMMLGYRKTCQRVGGNFTLLWHNSHFGCEADQRFYQLLLEESANG
jgi:hypothetical protein